MIHIVRKTTPRFTKCLSLVLIGLVLTEIQRFKKVKISKEMYCHPAPVVRKPISVNPRLNRPNPWNKFVLRLNSVPRSSISTIQGLNQGLNLTHLARWIKETVSRVAHARLSASRSTHAVISRSNLSNQNGGLTLC